MSTNSLTPKSLHATGIAMAVISSTVFAVRMYLGFVKRRRVSWEDGFLIVAWTFFFAVTVMYLQATSLIFRIEALATGKVTPANYPGDLAADTLRIQITFFITTIGLWLCLWCVKASLMTLYKRLMANLQPWITCWWIVVVVCLLALVGAIVSSIMSCSSLNAWFSPGGCSSARDVRASYISLWYSYSVDVLTDILVMVLPLGLIRNLQLHWRRKASIIALFCLGWVCIAVSTVRAAYLDSSSGPTRYKQPSSSWLALWGIVESAIAVIIGCGPGLYREAKVISSSRRQYYENSYHDGSYFRSGGAVTTIGGGRPRRSRNNTKDLSSTSTSSNGKGADRGVQSYPLSTVLVDNTGSSQEELVHPQEPAKIMVTQSYKVTNEENNAVGTAITK